MVGRRVIIADRSELFALGVSELLAARGYEVVGVATSQDEALALVANHPEAMLILDEELEDVAGSGFIKRMVDAHPQQPTVVLNGGGSPDDVVLALASGASGVIDKSGSREHLFAAIDVVAGGGMVFCSRTTDLLRDQLTEVFDLIRDRTARKLALTARELEVLELLPTAMTLAQIAARLFISRKTVQNNASSLYKKLHAHGRADAVAKAIALGLITPQVPADRF